MRNKTLTDSDGDTLTLHMTCTGIYLTALISEGVETVGPFTADDLRAALDEIAPENPATTRNRGRLIDHIENLEDVIRRRNEQIDGYIREIENLERAADSATYGLTAAEHLQTAQAAGLTLTDEMVDRGVDMLRSALPQPVLHRLALRATVRAVVEAVFTPPRPEWETSPYVWAWCADGYDHRCIYTRHEESGVTTWHNTDRERLRNWEMESLSPAPVAPEQKED